MKYFLILLSLFYFTFCANSKIKRKIAVTDTFIGIRKNLLECIVKTENASPELKQYASDFLKTDLKGDLNLGQFRTNQIDNDVLKKCRREIFSNKKRMNKI